MIIRIKGWTDIYCTNVNNQAEEYGAALCLGLCQDVKVLTDTGEMVHEFIGTQAA